MKKFLFFILVLNELSGQPLYFPPNNSNQWDTMSPQRLAWCDDKIDSLYNFLEASNSRGFILLKDGKIVLEKYPLAWTFRPQLQEVHAILNHEIDKKRF